MNVSQDDMTFFEPSSYRSVQCPDSTLALKTSILREATGLAMKEATTVRITIQRLLTIPAKTKIIDVFAKIIINLSPQSLV